MHPMKNREFMAIGPQLFKVFTRQWVIPPPAYTNICYLSEKKNGIIRKKDVFIKKGDRPSAFIVNLHFYGNLYSYYFFLYSLPPLFIQQIFIECLLLCARGRSRPRAYRCEQNKTTVKSMTQTAELGRP